MKYSVLKGLTLL